MNSGSDGNAELVELSGVVLDCVDARQLANFYIALLGWLVVHRRSRRLLASCQASRRWDADLVSA